MDKIKQFEPFFGEWYAESFIGAGSFGRVYKIYREELGYRFYSALKYISIPAESSEIKQLRADGLDDASITSYYGDLARNISSEITMMDKLRGITNIVSFEDSRAVPKPSGVGYDIFIRMELLDSLTNRMAERPLTQDDVIKLGADICTALVICSKKGIIHRDIKPDNIFISSNGDYKLGDFGIARRLEKAVDFMSKKGTYSYMAPEVYRGEQYGASCDVYSLGLVMYRLMNRGRLPFLPSAPNPISPADSERAMTRRMKGETIPAPSEAKEELSRIILKACAYRREERYSSAAEMLEDISFLRRAAKNRIPPYDRRRDREGIPGGYSPNTYDPSPKAPAYGNEGDMFNETTGAFSAKPIVKKPAEAPKQAPAFTPAPPVRQPAPAPRPAPQPTLVYADEDDDIYNETTGAFSAKPLVKKPAEAPKQAPAFTPAPPVRQPAPAPRPAPQPAPVYADEDDDIYNETTGAFSARPIVKKPAEAPKQAPAFTPAPPVRQPAPAPRTAPQPAPVYADDDDDIYNETTGAFSAKPIVKKPAEAPKQAPAFTPAPPVRQPAPAPRPAPQPTLVYADEDDDIYNETTGAFSAKPLVKKPAEAPKQAPAFTPAPPVRQPAPAPRPAPQPAPVYADEDDDIYNETTGAFSAKPIVKKPAEAPKQAPAFTPAPPVRQPAPAPRPAPVYADDDDDIYNETTGAFSAKPLVKKPAEAPKQAPAFTPAPPVRQPAPAPRTAPQPTPVYADDDDDMFNETTGAFSAKPIVKKPAEAPKLRKEQRREEGPYSEEKRAKDEALLNAMIDHFSRKAETYARFDSLRAAVDRGPGKLITKLIPGAAMTAAGIAGGAFVHRGVFLLAAGGVVFIVIMLLKGNKQKAAYESTVSELGTVRKELAAHYEDFVRRYCGGGSCPVRPEFTNPDNLKAMRALVSSGRAVGAAEAGEILLAEARKTRPALPAPQALSAAPSDPGKADFLPGGIFGA